MELPQEHYRLFGFMGARDWDGASTRTQASVCSHLSNTANRHTSLYPDICFYFCLFGFETSFPYTCVCPGVYDEDQCNLKRQHFPG